MKPEFNNSKPIYIQIMDEIKMLIVSGRLNSGDKVKPVRELAEEFGVNPNTMQRALSELEREGLLYAERTSGRFITTDGGRIMTVKETLAQSEIKRFMESMEKLGFTVDDIIRLLKEYKGGGKSE